MGWGWRPEHFIGVHKRLEQRLSCYGEVPLRHAEVFDAMAHPKAFAGDERAKSANKMTNGTRTNQTMTKAVEEVEGTNEQQKMERKHDEMVLMRELIGRIHR